MFTVKTEKRGVLTFSELPKNTYFAEGFNGTKPGQAFYHTWDNGTCLIPIKDKKGQDVIIPERAGTSI